MKTEELHQILQKSVEEDEDLKGAVLTKWVAVMDFMTPQGERYLVRRFGEGMPKWDVQGLLRYDWQ